MNCKSATTRGSQSGESQRKDLTSISIIFDLSSFQRSIKAIGTFCFQTTKLGKPRFEHSIPPTLSSLQECSGEHPELKKAMTLLAPLFGDHS